MAALTFSKAPLLAKGKESLLAEIANQRWQASLVFTFNGTAGVASDDQAQNRAANTLALLSQPETDGAKVAWELTPGNVIQMDREAVRQLGLAMGLHVQACWGRAAALIGQVVAAASLADLAAIDPSSGWPA